MSALVICSTAAPQLSYVCFHKPGKTAYGIEKAGKSPRVIGAIRGSEPLQQVPVSALALFREPDYRIFPVCGWGSMRGSIRTQSSLPDRSH